MVDRLPEFQGPKYAGSFRRGDFADFHQRFSLVPRRCARTHRTPSRIEELVTAVTRGALRDSAVSLLSPTQEFSLVSRRCAGKYIDDRGGGGVPRAQVCWVFSAG